MWKTFLSIQFLKKLILFFYFSVGNEKIFKQFNYRLTKAAPFDFKNY